MSRAQRRWRMISQVIRDPVLMALLKQAGPLEREESEVQEIEEE